MLRLYLPELRRLSIYGDHAASGTLRFDGDSLLVSGKLQALSLRRAGTVTFTPDSFVRLTALATLKLSSCGLIHIPAAVTALAGSLTSLALPLDNDLQMADGTLCMYSGCRSCGI